MRKSKKKQTVNKILGLVLVAAFLAVAGLYVYEFFFNKKEDTKMQTSSANMQHVVSTPSENHSETKLDNKSIEKSNAEEGKKLIQKYEGNNPNGNEELTGVITYAGATSANIMIRVNIDQYVDNGSCVLKMIKNNIVEYEEQTNLIADVSTSTCEGYNISRAALQDGKYTIQIKLTSNNKSGVISGEISL